MDTNLGTKIYNCKIRRAKLITFHNYYKKITLYYYQISQSHTPFNIILYEVPLIFVALFILFLDNIYSSKQIIF